ncbi:MAG: peptidoglycan-binding protein [Patescibacteria group bacterium]|nr:peptidoglycan-binding protein [Patescibacteria group bacterium]MDE1966682.1 peptidoglycan-binding protein [Patescibacteria group bacterium]
MNTLNDFRKISFVIAFMAASVPVAAFAMVSEATASPVPTAAPTAPATSGSSATGSVSPSATSGTASSGTVTSSAAAPTVPTGGADTTGAVIGSPTTGGSATTGAVTSSPTTGGSSTNGAVTSSPTTGGSSTNGAVTGSAPAPAPAPSPAQTSSSGSSVYGMSGGYSSFLLAPASTGYSTTSCPLITSFMKKGAANDRSQVVKLQAFLKDAEHLNVQVTGIFDQQTENAVKAFQRANLTAVMGPWSATRPSGIVYITTAKKINQIACAAPLTLNPSELAIINAYVAGQNTASIAAGQSGSSVGSEASIGSASSTETAVATGTIETSASQTASAANANPSIFQRIWNFIVGLFR